MKIEGVVTAMISEYPFHYIENKIWFLVFLVKNQTKWEKEPTYTRLLIQNYTVC